MDFKLQPFEEPMIVTALANIHYFEFTKEFHSVENHHDFCELLYVDSGKIEVLSENFNGIVCENEMVIHRPCEKHSLKGCGNESPNVIIIGFECKSEHLSPFSKFPVSLSSEHKKIMSRIMQEGMSIFEPPYDIPNTVYMKKREKYPFGADQMIRVLLETFLITIVRDFCGEDKKQRADMQESLIQIDKVREYLSEHYTENISLDSLCFIFGTNKSSLCREFKSKFSKTVLEYINSLKISSAKRMLRNEEMSISEISDALGFDTIHYFSRFFKKHTGVSPSKYSRSIKSKLNL